MVFSESLKSDIRRRADMRCCLCQAIGVEVHHLLSTAEGGPDDAENAAPLCPSCHETYGANPTKRKFIREARDHWFALCEQRRSLYPDGLAARIVASLQTGVTKEDLAAAKGEILSALRQTNPLGFNLDDGPGETLGRILQWLFEEGGPSSKVSVEDRDFLHFFVWGGTLDDPELAFGKLYTLLLD